MMILNRASSCTSCIFLYLYLQCWIQVSAYGFEIYHIRLITTISSCGSIYKKQHLDDPTETIRNRRSNENHTRNRSTHIETQVVSMDSSNLYSDLLPNPNPTFQAIDVVTACMDTFVENRHDTKIGLDVCFAFSNDRCRAAIGGNINEFYQYATNPTFAYLTSCVSYRIISIGPIINGTTHRGAMQTILLDVVPSITTSMTTSTTTTSPSSSSSSSQYPSKLNTIQSSSTPPPSTPTNNSTPRRFLWTLQQERRPPLQNCWMIHEVLYTKNAFQQTM